MIETIIVFIIVLAVLILVHEWGHFIVARRYGLQVEEFGFGFPPALFKFKIKDTVYSLNLIPLGGFVKILGEDGAQKGSPQSFASRSVSQRSKIIAAGVAMNFLLALILIIIGFNIGIPQALDDANRPYASNLKFQVSFVNRDSPAEASGLEIGDEILGIDGLLVSNLKEFQDYIKIKSQRQETLSLKIKRGGDFSTLALKPRLSPPKNEGPIGIALVETGTVRFPWYQSLWQGLKTTVLLTGAILTGLFLFFKNVLVWGVISKDIAGPVGIAVLTGQALNLGPTYVLELVALISLNLAILNLVPFPALDGGRLLFLAIEKIKGSPVPPKVENFIHTVGLALLMALAIFITWQDILKIK